MNTLHRLLVAVTGQPDALATPMNTTAGLQHVDTREAWKAPDFWGRPGNGCRCETEAFNCRQGRDCPLSEPVKESQTFRKRANWLAAGQALIGLVGFAAILALLSPNN